MMQLQRGTLVVPFSIALLATVPGCFNNSEKKPSGEAVVLINGKPVISAEEFDQSIELLAQAQPAFAQVLPFMSPEQQEPIYLQIAETLAAERMMHEAVKRSGVDKTKEYQENARRIHESVDRDLAVRAFQNDLAKQIVITDDEAREFYDAQKDKNQAFKRAPFVTHGGVVARAVPCGDEKEANELLQIVLKSKNLDTAAAGMKKEIIDLGIVNTQSFSVDNALRAKISVMKKFPAFEVVRDSAGEFFVVEGMRREESGTASFDTVRERVKEVMLGDRFNDALLKKLEELKREYAVTINKDFIAKKVNRSAQSAEQADAAQESKAGEAVEDTAR
jgi:hypothetical protein